MGFALILNNCVLLNMIVSYLLEVIALIHVLTFIHIHPGHNYPCILLKFNCVMETLPKYGGKVKWQ
jgi:hypothetical protein